ncbi:MAG TPA: hypothetical protein VGJ20_33045 [Xanthobacteraceae bacterium]|jgi:hypothetical protein
MSYYQEIKQNPIDGAGSVLPKREVDHYFDEATADIIKELDRIYKEKGENEKSL